MGGTDREDNLIQLTMREHFLAHWLLWKSYPKNFKITSAFLQMINKNPKNGKPFQGRVTSRVYEALKINAYSLASERMKGKVFVKDAVGKTIELTKDEYKKLKKDHAFHTTGKVFVTDDTGNTVELTKEEYKKQKHLRPFHTTGKVFVKDDTGNTVELTKEEYKTQRQLRPFHTTGKVSAINRSTGKLEWIDSSFYRENKDKFIVRIAYCEYTKYRFENQLTKEIIWCTRKEARETNASVGYKLLKKCMRSNVQIRCKASGGTILIPANEYDPSIHKHILSNTMPVFDVKENKLKVVSVDEYRSDPNRYTTSTKGKVLAKDKDGNNVLVTSEEFASGQFVGQTHGLRTVFDLTAGEYKQISKEEWEVNKSKYSGPCSGKINVIEIETGIRKQIPKEGMDKSKYLPLGNKKYLFRCRNKLTNKEKFINIYEWHIVKDLYEVIDLGKFNSLAPLIKL